MNRKTITAAFLTALFVFTAAPVFEGDFTGTDSITGRKSAPGISWSRPACAQAGETDSDASLHLLPLMTGTQYFEDRDEKGVLLRSHWSTVDVYGKDREPFRKISDALTEYNMEENSRFHAGKRKLLGEAKNERNLRLQSGAPFFGPFENKSDIYVRRADSRAVSFQEDFYSYMGGVHGLGGIIGKNFDASSGNELQLTDIFSDMDGMAEAIKKQLMFDYPKASFMSSGGMSMKKAVDEAAKNGKLIWTLDPRGVTFYFNPYHIGAYAEGIFVTTVLFSEYPGIYKKNEYTGAIAWRGPKAYCMELRPYLTFRLSDSPRDDRISVSEAGTHIVINFDEVYKDPVAVKEIRPTVVNCLDGRRYLYVDYSPNKKDFRLRVYDLTGSVIKPVGEFPMTRLASFPKDAAVNRRWYVMSDPSDFFMTAVAGSPFTEGVRLRCRVGADGRPEVIDVEGAKG